jgi:CarD family transcriptional regulator
MMSSVATTCNGRSTVRFAEGQTLVHPHHGPATVRAIAPRKLRGRECPYVFLDVHGQRLTIGVPVHGADAVGLREVLDTDHLREIFDLLAGAPGPQERQWSRRIKDNREKLATGSPLRIAEVVRDLLSRRNRVGLSPAEMWMLKDAKKPLAAEIGLALGITAAEADLLIESSQTGAGPAGRPES